MKVHSLSLARKFGRVVASLGALFLSFLSLSVGLWAQSAANSGQILGQILDPSGAAVAGAEVRARNKNTNHKRLGMQLLEGLAKALAIRLRHTNTELRTLEDN